MTDLNVYKDEFCISTEKAKLDLKAIHHFLSTQAYWSQNIPFNTVAKASENSLNFGMYFESRQIGYARIISDYGSINISIYFQ